MTAVETLKAAAIEPQMQARYERQLAGYVTVGFRAVGNDRFFCHCTSKQTVGSVPHPGHWRKA